ncbi:hypothetical protein P7K49_035620, partial [Saguinus oedipus]
SYGDGSCTLFRRDREATGGLVLPAAARRKPRIWGSLKDVGHTFEGCAMFNHKCDKN